MWPLAMFNVLFICSITDFYFPCHSRWEKLTQELKVPKGWHVAFFVSDDLVHCSNKADAAQDMKDLKLKE